MPFAPLSHSQRQATKRRKAADKRRASPTVRGYGGRWRRWRRWYLQSVEYICRECMRHHRVTPATEVDHIVPMSKGGEQFDTDNCQALCHSCHSRKTAREDGGFGVRHLSGAAPDGRRGGV